MNELINDNPVIQCFILSQNGNFPNSTLPVLIYHNALQLPAEKSEAEAKLKSLFQKNNWGNNWVDSIYDFHHYHSNTHEVLGICNGTVTVQFGGPGGNSYTLSKGDVIMIPAGLAHKRISSDNNFSCVGGYPQGKDYDMNYGKEGELEKSKDNIKKVAIPETDPLYGENGRLLSYWK